MITMKRAALLTPLRFGLVRILLAAAVSLPSTAAVAGSFPDRVVDYQLGTDAGFGESNLPDNVLGPPNGNTDTTAPQESATELLSLGNGGWITLEFTDTKVVDGPGPDFIVFENTFVPISAPTVRFIEAAIVLVSQDGDEFTTFPFNFNTYPDGRVGQPDQYEGFAGVTPTLSSPGNGVSPTDPAVAGGDAFDLADVGLSWIRFIRIRDTGMPGAPTETLDGDGDAVDDSGNAQSRVVPATSKSGFDLDAVAAIHAGPYNPEGPTAAADVWLMAP